MDIVYLTHNRLEYTQRTFPTMLACVRKGVDRLWAIDDDSVDGTWEYVRETLGEFQFRDQCKQMRGIFGNPNGALNLFLADSHKHNPSVYVSKIDNDYQLIDPDVYTLCEEIFAEPNGSKPLGILGFVANAHGDVGQSVQWVGGNYVARRDVFYAPVPTNAQFFGWTRYQQTLLEKWELRWSDEHYAISVDDLSENQHLRKLYADKGWGRIFVS